jgi:uncharacterized protein (TIGR03067 family)
MVRPLVLLLLASAVVAAPVPKSLKKPATLDGRWKVAAMTLSGRDVSANSPTVWDIREGVITRHFTNPDGSLRAEGLTITITAPDPTKPDEVDYVHEDGQQKFKWRARLRLTGDELVIRFTGSDAALPDDVTDDKDGYLYRFKRVEEK